MTFNVLVHLPVEVNPSRVRWDWSLCLAGIALLTGGLPFSSNIKKQYNTIQYNTIQYNTTQHNTARYDTIRCEAKLIFISGYCFSKRFGYEMLLKNLKTHVSSQQICYQENYFLFTNLRPERNDLIARLLAIFTNLRPKKRMNMYLDFWPLSPILEEKEINLLLEFETRKEFNVFSSLDYFYEFGTRKQ